MESAVFLPLIIWSVLTIVVALRSTLHVGFRILSVVMLLITGFFWWDEFYKAFELLANFTPALGSAMLHQAMHMAFLALVWVWPVVLITTLVSTDQRGNAMALIILSVFSLLVWIGYLYTGFVHLG